MKQCLWKSILSRFLILTLIASVVAGAFSVSPVFADTPENSGTGYLGDIFAEIEYNASINVYPGWNQSSYESCKDFILSKAADIEENETYLVSVIHDAETADYAISVLRFPMNAYYSCQNSNGTSNGVACFADGGLHNGYAINLICALYVSGSHQNQFMSTGSIIQSYPWGRADVDYAFNFSSSVWPTLAVPNSLNNNIAGRYTWVSRPILQGTSNWSTDRNLNVGFEPDPWDTYYFTDAWIGSRHYLTFTDQSIVRHYNTMEEGNLYVYFTEDEDPDPGDIFVGSFMDFPVQDFVNTSVMIPDGALYFTGITNVGSNGVVYAFDITGYDKQQIFYSFYMGEELMGQAGDLPYSLHSNGLSQNYQESVQEYITNINNFFNDQTSYNTNYVLPETGLPSYVKNLLGDNAVDRHTFEVINNGSHVGLVVNTNNISYTWLPEQYIIFDVELFNDIAYDGVSVNNNPFYFYLSEMFNQADCVIILSHDDFKSITTYNTGTGDALDPDFISNCIFYFEEELGGAVTKEAKWFGSYLTEIGTGDTTVSGLTFFTNHYLLHVQNMILADGMKSICGWLDDYGSNAGEFQRAALAGIGAAATAVATLDGNLSLTFSDPNSFFGKTLTLLESISLKIDGLSQKLDQISVNTDDPDPDNVSPWYLSLWNFVKQFNPSNSQISQGIDSLEDNLDDLPLLPALTPVPALPTLGG